MIIYSFEFAVPFEAPHRKAQIFETNSGFSGGFGDTGAKYHGNSFSDVVHKMRQEAPELPIQLEDWNCKNLPEPEGR